jgi:hypothetical protein
MDEIDWNGDVGVFLRRDALADGCDDKTLRRLVHSGVLHRIRRGAYIDAAVWRRLDAVGRHRVTARAVLRTAHPSAALTHVSALLELGAPVWNVDLNEIHVTRTDGPGDAKREWSTTVVNCRRTTSRWCTECRSQSPRVP